MDEPKKVKVACGHPGGIVLRVFESRPGEFIPGSSVMTEVGRFELKGPSSIDAGVGNSAPGVLQPVVGEVDADLWKAWVAQNEGKNPMFDTGLIHEVPEENPTQEAI